MNTSQLLLVSAGSKFEEHDSNRMCRPLLDMDPPSLELLPSVPSLATLTRDNKPVYRSRRKTSLWLLVSPGTRLAASELKTTNRPSPLIARDDVAWSTGPAAGRSERASSATMPVHCGAGCALTLDATIRTQRTANRRSVTRRIETPWVFEALIGSNSRARFAEQATDSTDTSKYR